MRRLGPGSASWLVNAAAAGTGKIRVKMRQAVEFAAVYGTDEVDTALAVAADACRFAEADLASILRHRRRGRRPRPCRRADRRGALAAAGHIAVA